MGRGDPLSTTHPFKTLRAAAPPPLIAMEDKSLSLAVSL